MVVNVKCFKEKGVLILHIHLHVSSKEVKL